MVITMQALAQPQYVRTLSAWQTDEDMPSYNDTKRTIRVMNLEGELIRQDYFNQLTGHLLASIFLKNEKFKCVKYTEWYYKDLHTSRLRDEISEKVIEFLGLKNETPNDIF